MKPKISIITVVYNDVKNVEKSILNTLSQTYRPIELIVVDGASTDGTIDVIRRYSNQIKWISEPDKGIYDAMNKGIRLSTGEWILFHNCGDFFISKDSISDFFRELNDTEDVAFLIGNIVLFNEYGYKEHKPFILSGSIYEGMPVNHPATFNRAKWQKRRLFNAEFRNSGDYDFYMRSFLDGAKYKYINQSLVLMDHRSGATVDNNQIRLRENLRILKEYNAPISFVRELSKQLKYQQLVDVLTRALPFISWIRMLRRKYYYQKKGWIKADIESMLDNL